MSGCLAAKASFNSLKLSAMLAHIDRWIDSVCAEFGNRIRTAMITGKMSAGYTLTTNCQQLWFKNSQSLDFHEYIFGEALDSDTGASRRGRAQIELVDFVEGSKVIHIV